MIPLFINNLHWKTAKLLLQPLFGYIFTLNINGFTTEQFYTLYFLVYERVIIDMLKNENSEAIKRIHSQVKMCCMDIFESFKQRLDPKIDDFLLKHTNRTKDVIPNLNSYLLFISMDANSLNRIKIDQANFEYFYCEEQLRRFLKSTFKQPESLRYFSFDILAIQNAVDKLFDYDYQHTQTLKEVLDKLESNGQISNVNNQTLFELLDTRFQIKFDFTVEKLLNRETMEIFKNYVNKFKSFNFSILYKHMFEVEPLAFSEEIITFALMHQLLNSGFTNEKWRNHASYRQFKSLGDSLDYLLGVYLAMFRDLFNKRYNEKVEYKKKEILNIKVKEFLNADPFEHFKFNASEKTFGQILKALQFEGNVTGVSKLVEKIFYIAFETPKHRNSAIMWEPSSRATKNSKRFRLFKMIYLHEKKNSELNHAKSIEFLAKRYPDNQRYVRYLFQLYSFEINRSVFGIANQKLKEFMDADLFLEFNKKKRIAESVSGNRNVLLLDTFVARPQTQTNDILELKQRWISEQFALQKQNMLDDSKEWQKDLSKLKRVCVLGVTYRRQKRDNSTACGAVLVFQVDHDRKKLILAYANLVETQINEHCILGLEAFRVNDLYEKMVKQIPANLEPDCFIFNGHGLLNEREFGLASQIGVQMNIVSIGLCKKMTFIKNTFSFKNLDEAKCYYKPLLKKSGDHVELKVTSTGKILGYAFLSNAKALGPLFLSQGDNADINMKINYTVKLVFGLR